MASAKIFWMDRDGGMVFRGLRSACLLQHGGDDGLRALPLEAQERAIQRHDFLLFPQHHRTAHVFDDASEGEFRWPGQGTMYELMPNGTTGLAYTRGERLIQLRKF